MYLISRTGARTHIKYKNISCFSFLYILLLISIVTKRINYVNWIGARVQRQLMYALADSELFCARCKNICKFVCSPEPKPKGCSCPSQSSNISANQSQISCGSSLGWGTKVCIYKWSMSHDQDGHHAYIILW